MMGYTFTDLTSITFLRTVIAQVDSFPEAVALIVARPSEIPVTRPDPLTAAIVGFRDSHCTAGFSPSGEKVT